jgi:predicted O-linked N-acetylglucosamine transferase (SPINDLY family)
MTQMTVQQAYDLGLGHIRAGRSGEAEAVLRQVVGADPNHLPSWLALAQLYYQTGRAAPALDAMRRAVTLDPRNPDLQGNLGTVLAATGQLDEAINVFVSAISLSPNSAGLYSNLGNALQAKGLYEQAVEAYRRAIAFQPASFEAHNNIGTAFMALDRKDEAIPEFRAALSLRPDFVQALNNLGTALGEKGFLDEAIKTCLRAIQIDPNFLGIYRNLGNSYRDAGRLDDAIAAYRKASEKKDDPAAMDDLFIALLLHPHLTREQVWQEHVTWNREYAKPLIPAHISHPNDANPDRRLKIGYVSPDFSEHPVGRFFLPLIANHDHTQFEIYCYDDTRRPDTLTQQAKAHAEVWRRTLGMPDENLAHLIRQDRIDILVDLTMHTKRNRLLAFARMPAPVQTTYLAYPGTTGLETMDYRITDPYLDPPDADEQFQSEKTVRLPHAFWCYQPHRLVPEVAPLPAATRGFIMFGCLNLFGKMNAPMFDLWAQILNNVPNSRIVLYCFEGSQRDRLLEHFAAKGIESARIELVPRSKPAEYFAKYRQIDIALDTSPFPGGTTSCDALWMGVPVVTLAGNTPLSRGGVSILSNVGLTELIAGSRDQYVEIATALAKDPQRIANYRTTLRDRMSASPLMNAPQHARDIEAAFRRMWRNWCQSPARLR